MACRPVTARLGFTLIEILAVIVIIGLTMSLLLPNLAATRGSRLRQQALDVASRIELARERAIVTGAPHRLMLDLETGEYRVEWFVREERAAGIAPEPEQTGQPFQAGESTGGAQTAISLSPSLGEGRDYYPINSRFGTNEALPEDSFFAGVQTPEGWIERGSVQVVFARDGTTDFAEIVLSDAWDNRVVLEVQPLLDMVRIRNDDES